MSDILWATVQRAGYYWLAYMYAIVLTDLFFGCEIDLEAAETVRHRYYRHPTIRWDFREDLLEPFHYELPIPRLLHTHDSYRKTYQHYPVLLQIRNPYDLLISKYYFNHFHRIMTFSEYLETEAALYVPQFFNTWGNALADRSEVCIIRFEDLRLDASKQLVRVLRFCGIDRFTDEQIRRAVEETTLDKIRAHHMKREQAQNTSDVSHGRSGKVGQVRELAPGDQECLRAFVRAEFQEMFGYDCH